MTIQTIINDTPVNGICVLPGGIIDVPAGTSFTIPRSMIIEGNNTTINVGGNTVPINHLFNADGLPNGSRLTVRNLTINGPDTTGWPNTASTDIAAIGWRLYKTWDSTFTIENVTTTGGYGYGVHRSGGGRFEIINSHLSAFVGGFAFFEGHGGHGSLLVQDSVIEAPQESKYSSVGCYIHPHLHVTMERTEFINWNRYGVYLNGNPQSSGHHDFIEVVATDCSLIQTGSSSVTTLVRCIERGTPTNGGSFCKGPLLSVGSQWLSSGLIGTLNGIDCERKFVNDYIAPKNLWSAYGGQTVGKLTLIGCTIDLNNKATFLSISGGSTLAVEIIQTVTNENGTARALIVQGGSVKYIDSNIPVLKTVTAPGTLL